MSTLSTALNERAVVNAADALVARFETASRLSPLQNKYFLNEPKSQVAEAAAVMAASRINESAKYSAEVHTDRTTVSVRVENHIDFPTF